jgi:DeoR family transcriptional regulator, myo-inositol catabolism operon repressor
MRVQRISQLEKYLIENNSASHAELCEKFNVSLNTIRRDIEELEDRGVITKVYGGIVLNADSNVVPLSTRSTAHKQAKETICKLASNLLTPGSTIYIDSGTTTVPLLKYITPDMNITVISNSLNIYNEATKYPALNIISLGGLLSFNTNSFVGISTIKHLEDYKIHQAFMSATAVSILSGATNNSYHESEIKKAVIKHSTQTVLLADSSKLSNQASLSFCPLEQVDALVTEVKPPEKFVAYLNQANIDLRYDI